MDHPFLKELSDLLQQTEKLLDSSEPDGEAWEGYGRMRHEVFTRLEAAGALETRGDDERAALREVISRVIERDRLLMQKLEQCLACCREGLSTVPKARQALNGYLPPRSASLVQRHV